MASKPPKTVELFTIVYDSVAGLPFGKAGVQALRDIVDVAKARNATLGITGVLYFDGAYFMQALEGDRAAVEAVYDSITHDPRHSDIRLIARAPLGERAFAAWSMVLIDEDELNAALQKHRLLSRAIAYRAPEFITAMRAVLAERQV